MRRCGPRCGRSRRWYAGRNDAERPVRSSRLCAQGAPWWLIGLTRARERDGGRGEELFTSSESSVVDPFSPRRTSSLTSLRESFSNWPHTGSSTMAETRRNTVCTFAMPPEESASSHRALSTPNECSSISPTITRIEPAMLKRIWITPVRLASAFEPMGADDGRRHTVANVDADDDGVNGRKCQRAGRGNGLQNTDGRRRTLQQERNARAEQEPEHRLSRELVEHVGKRLRFRQRAHRRGHAEKAGEEDAEAHRDRADGIGLAGLDRPLERGCR